jgi:hypothetical protein
MESIGRKWPRLLSICCSLFCVAGLAAQGQQVVQRGAFGQPGQVLDDTGQWSTPLLVASDADVQLYIPDVSNPDWLQKNYREYIDHGTYVLTMFTFYKTPAACQANLIGWGLGDQEHLDDCLTIGYRLRKARLQPQGESVTLLEAAMVDQNGNIDQRSMQTQKVFRTWNQLDANTREALHKADALVQKQMKIYDARMQNRK